MNFLMQEWYDGYVHNALLFDACWRMRCLDGVKRRVGGYINV